MSGFRKFLAIGCNHSTLADPIALDAVLAFKKTFSPDTVIHLGDNFDLAALRSGAKGTKDESASLEDDIKAGTEFIERLEPNVIFDGNHDRRVRNLVGHPNAMTAYFARQLCNELDDLARRLKAKQIPYDIDAGWLKLGDTLFGHGYMYNQMAIRDHAETFGKCVIAHLHRVGQERGRALNSPTAYCVGYLGDKAKFTYADTQRSRLAWSQGFAWGEYSNDHCIVRLEEKSPAGWRLPL